MGREKSEGNGFRAQIATYLLVIAVYFMIIQHVETIIITAMTTCHISLETNAAQMLSQKSRWNYLTTTFIRTRSKRPQTIQNIGRSKFAIFTARLFHLINKAVWTFHLHLLDKTILNIATNTEQVFHLVLFNMRITSIDRHPYHTRFSVHGKKSRLKEDKNLLPKKKEQNKKYHR
jgi:hypothetical protein